MDMKKLSQEPEIVCDNKECKKVIDVDIKTETLKDNSVGYYFTCNHCGEKYPIASVTPRGLKYLKRLKKIEAQLKAGEPVKKQYEKSLKLYQKEVSGPYGKEMCVDD